MNNIKIEAGDKVIYNGHKHDAYPEFFPDTGTIGTVTGVYDYTGGLLIQWPLGTTSGDGEWICSKRNVTLKK